MAIISKTEAIVLRSMRFRESSRIVSLYTRKFGKVKVVAKGVRRPKTKFGSALEPFTVSNIVFYKRETKDLYNISEADIVKERPELRTNLRRMATAYVIVDFLDAANPEESENPRLYALADSMLDAIEKLPASTLNLLLWTFLIRAAGILGYGPTFAACLRCNRKRPGMMFSPSLGGTVCRDCSLGERDIWKVSDASLNLLERLADEGEKDFSAENPSFEQTEEITQALRAHLLYHTERRMHSFDFKKSLEAANRLPDPDAAPHS